MEFDNPMLNNLMGYVELDDGKNKYTSDVLFLIWNALQDAGIEILFPQRVLHIKQGEGLPGA